MRKTTAQLIKEHEKNVLCGGWATCHCRLAEQIRLRYGLTMRIKL